ncbi:MAG: MFS transporter [Chromatiales bacterium]|nr:MAG: MFS transporter [Chromatiales bacterium]
MNEPKRFYYGWIIAICSLVIMWITNGITLAGLTVFDEELLNFLGGEDGPDGLRGALKFRDTITLLGSGLLAPLAGALADRIGVRPLMVVGLILLSVANFLYSRITSMGDIYGIHTIIAMSLAGAGLVVNVMIVSKWFVKNRGLAVGLTVAGTSLGNAALPQLNAWLIGEFGWRMAFVYTAGIPLLLIPIVLFVMREKPEDMGLVAPGSESLGGGVSHTQLGMSYREALRTSNFWLLASIAMLTFYSILALLTNLFLHMREQGFEPQVAASGLTVLFLLGLVGKLTSGVLADLYGRKRVFVGTLAIMCVGAWLLISTSDATFWPAIVLLGGGWGGLYTLLQLLAAETFGVRDLGKILGTITVLDTFGGGLGPVLTGLMYDRFGSYTIPFTIIAVLVTVALVLATRFRVTSQG